MAKRGRPSILDDTPEMKKKRKKFFSLLRAGLSRKTAAGAAGLGRATVLAALAKGRTQRRGPFRDFLDTVIECEDGGTATLHLSILRKATPALKWRMIRARRPEEYAPDWMIRLASVDRNPGEAARGRGRAVTVRRKGKTS